MPRPSRGAARRLERALALDDFEEMARRYLPRPIFGYVAGGSETNASLRDNRAAFAELAFLPRTLIDVTQRTQRTRLFGVEYSAPFGIAPMGLASLTAYRGELAMARAAARANIPLVLSGASLIRLEHVIKAAPGAWFQAYVPGQPDWFLPLLDRVERAGFETLVLTVDMAVVANRENNVRNGFSAPLRPSLRLAWDGLARPRWTLKTFLRTLALHGIPHFENMSANRGVPIVARDIVRRTSTRDDLDWASFDLIRRRWSGRLIVKGIMTAADARIACERGADGIVVSTHGGRQLDGTPSPLRVLPEIAETIAGAIPVMMDSGIRRGGDVLKALALGADFVFVGHPFMFAAAVAGEAGVAHACRLLAEEIDRDMALLGINPLDEMTVDRLMRIAGVAGGIRGSAFGSQIARACETGDMRS